MLSSIRRKYPRVQTMGFLFVSFHSFSSILCVLLFSSFFCFPLEHSTWNQTFVSFEIPFSFFGSLSTFSWCAEAMPKFFPQFFLIFVNFFCLQQHQLATVHQLELSSSSWGTVAFFALSKLTVFFSKFNCFLLQNFSKASPMPLQNYLWLLQSFSKTSLPHPHLSHYFFINFRVLQFKLQLFFSSFTMVHLFFFINPVEIDQVVVDMNFSMRLDKSGAVDDIDFVLEDFENLSQLFIQETNFTKPSDPSSLICYFYIRRRWSLHDC